MLALTPEIFLDAVSDHRVQARPRRSLFTARSADQAAPHPRGQAVVNIPSFLVRADSQKHIDYSLNSPLGGGRPGRVKRKRMAAAGGGGGDGEEEDE